MIYETIEKLLPRSNFSVYKLSLLASKRATELADGMPPLVDFTAGKKVTTIALEEISKGKVELKEVADERAAKEEKDKGHKKE